MTIPNGRVILVAVLLAAVVIGGSLLQRRRPTVSPQFQGPSGALREKILARQFVANLPAGPAGVPRCVLMDWNVGGGVATLVAFDDGSTSLYFSSGGGFIGAGAHQNVARAAAAFRAEGLRALSRFTPTDTFPVPSQDGHVVFYAVMDSVTLTSGDIPAGMTGLPRGHPLSGLFTQAQSVVSEIRRAR